ncbi:MAG: PEP-CTERM sorting domain-containing protein [Planctomycetia bacterium]|nr:PEP-CTERM sorting domain-containing protein [Planctomycetia bacterium]
MKKFVLSPFALGVLLSVLLTGDMYAANSSWNNATGDSLYSNAGNWSQGVPGSGEVAYLQDVGGDMILSSNPDSPNVVGIFAVRNDVTAEMVRVNLKSGYLTGSTVTMGNNEGTHGALTVSKGAYLTVNTELAVGNGGYGSLTVNEGGGVILGNSVTRFNIGNGSGAIGSTLNVNGGTLTSVRNFTINQDSSVNISNGGSMTITGTETNVIGAKAGTASLTISSGGSLTAKSGHLFIGNQDKADVVVTVTGEGSLMTLDTGNTYALGIGSVSGATGVLNIADKATVNAPRVLVGHVSDRYDNFATGTLNLSGGAVLNAYSVLIANGPYTHGHANVSGAGTVLKAPVTVGTNINPGERSAEMTVSDSATIIGAVTVGEYAGSYTNLGHKVSAVLNARTGATFAGDIIVGNGASTLATMNVTSGTVFTKNITVSNGSGNDGALYVDGATLLVGTTQVGTMGSTNDITVNTSGSATFTNGAIVNSRYLSLSGVLNVADSFWCGNTTVGSAATANMIGNSAYCSGVDGWTARPFAVSGGTLNLLANANGLPFLNTGSITVSTNSKINVGIDHGATLLQAASDKSWQLVEADGDFQWENGTHTNSIWSVAVDSTNKTVTASLNPAYNTGALEMNSGWAAITEYESGRGWFNLTGSFGENYVLELGVSGLESSQLDAFASWLDAGYDTFDASVTEDNTILLSSMSFSALDSQVFAWDFTPYEIAGVSLTGFQAYYVPEPAAWLLLTLGLFFLKRRR